MTRRGFFWNISTVKRQNYGLWLSTWKFCHRFPANLSVWLMWGKSKKSFTYKKRYLKSLLKEGHLLEPTNGRIDQWRSQNIPFNLQIRYGWLGTRTRTSCDSVPYYSTSSLGFIRFRRLDMQQILWTGYLYTLNPKKNPLKWVWVRETRLSHWRGEIIKISVSSRGVTRR